MRKQAEVNGPESVEAPTGEKDGSTGSTGGAGAPVNEKGAEAGKMDGKDKELVPVVEKQEDPEPEGQKAAADHAVPL